jgi:hypothetical protein
MRSASFGVSGLAGMRNFIWPSVANASSMLLAIGAEQPPEALMKRVAMWSEPSLSAATTRPFVY